MNWYSMLQKSFMGSGVPLSFRRVSWIADYFVSRRTPHKLKNGATRQAGKVSPVMVLSKPAICVCTQKSPSSTLSSPSSILPSRRCEQVSTSSWKMLIFSPRLSRACRIPVPLPLTLDMLRSGSSQNTLSRFWERSLHHTNRGHLPSLPFKSQSMICPKTTNIATRTASAC